MYAVPEAVNVQLIPQSVYGSKSPGWEISEKDLIHLPSKIFECNLPTCLSSEIFGNLYPHIYEFQLYILATTQPAT